MLYAPVASLVATGIALLLGTLTVHHCKRLMHDGVTMDQGGGYTVLIIVEFIATMLAVSAALTL